MFDISATRQYNIKNFELLLTNYNFFMPKKTKKIAKKPVVKKIIRETKNTIIPLADRVLVRPLTNKELEKKTDFGIIIPDTVDEEKVKDQGIVVAVGEGKYDDGKLNPMTVKVGDKVMFSKYGFDEIKLNDEEYFILKEENILAIIK